MNVPHQVQVEEVGEEYREYMLDEEKEILRAQWNPSNIQYLLGVEGRRYIPLRNIRRYYFFYFWSCCDGVTVCKAWYHSGTILVPLEILDIFSMWNITNKFNQIQPHLTHSYRNHLPGQVPGYVEQCNSLQNSPVILVCALLLVAAKLSIR